MVQLSTRNTEEPNFWIQYHRDDLYPTLAFRRTYDRLKSASPAYADILAVGVLHLAATLSVAEVETVLEEGYQEPNSKHGA